MTSILEAPDAVGAAPKSPAGVRARLSGRARERIALAVLLIATSVTYLWHITING
jgi:hypothetical protein